MEESTEEIKGFIKNYDLLKEDSKVEDLLDFTDITNSFANKIDSIDQPSIVGLIGEFGSGKSTMLYQIKKKCTKNVCWIDFDAWKYPDRKDLWEGFIIDFAEQLGLKEKTIKNINGESNLESTSDIIIEIANIFDDISVLKPLATLIKKGLKLSPAKRVFELQNILTNLINKFKYKFIIVVEDIDRSGDSGIYFLETLKQFLRELKTQRKIVVVVPIGTDNYENKLDSYLKSLDFIEFFEPKLKSIEIFVSRLFDEEMFQGELKTGNDIRRTGLQKKIQIISFLNHLLIEDGKVSIRLLKTILRNADSTFKIQKRDGYEPDLRITIMFEISKYLYYNSEKKSHTISGLKTNKKFQLIRFLEHFFKLLLKKTIIYINLTILKEK